MSTTSGASASATSLAHYLTGRHKPKANDRFLRHSKTWREVAKIVEDHPKGSVAFWIAALSHDPRNYDYAHVYDDSKIEGSEEYQKLVDLSYSISSSSQSDDFASGSRKRKLVQPSASSQPQPNTTATVVAVMTDSEDEDERPPRKRQRNDRAPPRSTPKEGNKVLEEWLDATEAVSNASCDLAEAESEHRKRTEDQRNGTIDRVRLAEAAKAVVRAKAALVLAQQKEKALERQFQSMQEENKDDEDDEN